MTIDLAKLTNLATAIKERTAKPTASTDSWYRIKNLGNSTGEIYLYRDIGGWGGITSEDFVMELSDLKVDHLDVHINSPGGGVFEGTAIFTALHNHPAVITSLIDGVAASMGSFIAMAADPYDEKTGKGGVHIAKHARMMIHDASGGCMGRASDMREMADLLDALSDTIAEAYHDRASANTITEWRTIMQGPDKWYNAKQSVAAGLADSIQGADDDTDAPAPDDKVLPVVTANDKPAVPEWNIDAAAFAELIRKAF